MTIDFVQRIYDFNKQAGLLDKGYSDFLESSFQIEEALEGFDMYELDLFLHGSESTVPPTAKDLSRAIVKQCYTEDLADVDRLDKAIDAIVFAVGSIAKLGLSPEQIHQAINIVMDANIAKLSCPKDEHGKLTKPADFISPEPLLQELLDSRK